MRLNDPFPLEELPPRVRQTILTEFGGHRPSIRDVASIPDTHWLTLPNMGPKVIAWMRSLPRGAHWKARVPSLAGMTDAKLQAKHDHLISLKKAIDDKLKAIKAELLLRSEANHTDPKRSP